MPWRALDLLDADPDLRVAVLHGAGAVFSAGADLGAISRGEDCRDAERGFGGIVRRPPAKPVVAAVEGWALGGGFEMVLACDLVIAAKGARFGLPEVGRGLVARGGGAIRLPQRTSRPVAMELLLTGRPIDAGRALQVGLVNLVTDDGGALDAARAVAGTIAVNAPLAVAATKKIADASRLWPDDEAFDRQQPIVDPVFASADAAEGARAFLDKREPRWIGR